MMTLVNCQTSALDAKEKMRRDNRIDPNGKQVVSAWSCAPMMNQHVATRIDCYTTRMQLKTRVLVDGHKAGRCPCVGCSDVDGA